MTIFQQYTKSKLCKFIKKPSLLALFLIFGALLTKFYSHEFSERKFTSHGFNVTARDIMGLK